MSTAPDRAASAELQPLNEAQTGAPQSLVLPHQGPARRRDPRDFHPFLRLNALLADIPPGSSPAPDGKPINLSVGDPQIAPPAYLLEDLTADLGAWGRYPPPRGTNDHAEACVAYLERRYDLPAGWLDPAQHVLPVPGSREGLFFAALALATAGADKEPERNAVLLPSPGYHCYMGAAAVAGLAPVFVPATAESNFLPDLAALPAHTLATSLLAYLCSPSNPQGTALDLEGWRATLHLARACGFALMADECYADVYLDSPPTGALQAAVAEGGALDGLLVFHSLSKRASAAGLRCGFIAGDPALIERVDACLRIGGAGVPLPIQRAGTRLWRDEALPESSRAYYRDLFARAERILAGRYGYSRPSGGFFLWLDVGDGEAAARKLWAEAGLRVLPGAYMAGPADLPDNAGARYIRVALVYDGETTERALARLVEVLGDGL